MLHVWIFFFTSMCPCPNSPSFVGTYTSTMVRICDIFISYWMKHIRSNERFLDDISGNLHTKPSLISYTILILVVRLIVQTCTYHRACHGMPRFVPRGFTFSTTEKCQLIFLHFCFWQSSFFMKKHKYI